MVKNKKAMSQIVTTLIIILLTIVAIGIIWVVVKNVLTKGSDQIDVSAKCLNTEVVATKVLCNETANGGNDGNCSVTYTRTRGEDEIGGIKILFTNDLGEENYAKELKGNIDYLTTRTEKGITTGIPNCSKVSIAVYFEDDSGNKNYCSQGPEFTF